jgi:hypothetical protein
VGGPDTSAESELLPLLFAVLGEVCPLLFAAALEFARAFESPLDFAEAPVPDFGGERDDLDAADPPAEVGSPAMDGDLDGFVAPVVRDAPEAGMVEQDVTNGSRTSKVHPSFFVRRVLKGMFINVRVSFK